MNVYVIAHPKDQMIVTTLFAKLMATFGRLNVYVSYDLTAVVTRNNNPVERKQAAITIADVVMVIMSGNFDAGMALELGIACGKIKPSVGVAYEGFDARKYHMAWDAITQNFECVDLDGAMRAMEVFLEWSASRVPDLTVRPR